MNNKISAIIVTYHPDDEVVENIKKIYDQVHYCIVIDNTNDRPKVLLDLEKEDLSKLVLVYNQANLGIAKACNKGVEIAKKNDSSWIATFDQDSTVEENMLVKMLETYNRFEDDLKERTAILTPRYFLPSIGKFDYKNLNEYEGEYKIINDSVSSGCLIKKEIFEIVKYDDGMFVDYFDLDFQLRLKKKTSLEIVECFQATLNHGIGKLSTTKFFGKSFIPNNYPPIRRYYQARNRFRVYSRYLTYNPKWCLRDAKNSTMDIIKIILAEDEKIAKLRAVCLGILDFILGREGITNWKF
jgi:rhamnosyltransferase